MSSVPEREEIDEQYKWSLNEVYSDTNAWERDRDEVEELIERLEDFRSSLMDSPSKLLEALQIYEELMRRVQKLSRYASMKKDEDTRNQEAQEMYSKAKSLSSKASSKSSFIAPEIQEAGRETVEEFINEEEDLEKYRHHIDDILRVSNHTRSKEIENLLADFGEITSNPGNVYQVFTNADLEFPIVEKPGEGEVRITQGNFTKFLKHEDREFRNKVYEKFYERLSEYRNTIGSTLEGSIKADVKMAKARNYETSRKASLNQDNIPVKVYDNLVDQVNENLEPLHRHLKLKEKLLDVDNLKMHDIYMPLSRSEPEISFEEAKNYVLSSVKPLGSSYVENMEKAFDNRWIDVYENKGKRSGAYSGGAYDTKPFILMNYQDDVNSMYTLAHELGHSMHSFFTNQNQPYIYSSYPIFLAEVASTVNEALLTEYLLENGTEAMKKAALSHSLENFRTTLYRQTMFADFEHEIHRRIENGEALTPKNLDEAYGKLKERFYEPAEIDENIRKEWMKIPHFYWSYYVFQYSTGMSAALSLTQKIIDEGPEKYLEFLKKGSSQYPLEALNDAGVDMKSENPVKKAVSAYKEQVERAEDIF